MLTSDLSHGLEQEDERRSGEGKKTQEEGEKKVRRQIKESQREDEMKKSIQRSTKSLKFVCSTSKLSASLMLLAISGSKKLLQFP